MKIFVVEATILLLMVLFAGCGPNDRIRDTYWGKAEDYQPVERDPYGEPVLKDDSTKKSEDESDDRGED